MTCGKKVFIAAVAALVVTGSAVAATLTFHSVAPSKFDPGNTKLVASQWISGIGCPTNAKQTTGGTYSDPACPKGDPKDNENKGLLMAKTGPTTNNASAVAQLKDIPSSTVTELGYDLRKAGADQNDPRGSHCGAGAPRFNVVTSSGTFFVGCNSPPPTVTPGEGFMRLRWSVNFTDVKAIYIIFDEGTDTGPDNFGAAVLDNIDLNGTLVGRG
jgi:hypothetical protein